jgi:hypothetical protein
MKLTLTILIEMTPAINNTAVIPFVVAYIGGKRKRFNIITEIFKFNSKKATATGIMIDTIIHLFISALNLVRSSVLLF